MAIRPNANYKTHRSGSKMHQSPSHTPHPAFKPEVPLIPNRFFSNSGPFFPVLLTGVVLDLYWRDTGGVMEFLIGNSEYSMQNVLVLDRFFSDRHHEERTLRSPSDVSRFCNSSPGIQHYTPCMENTSQTMPPLF